MSVKRIVANLKVENFEAVRDFYEELFGLSVAMDMGWIVTLASEGNVMTPQLSLMREGGSGTDVPELSIEVEDVDAVHALAMERGVEIVYALTNEPWGVRRFYVRDPDGRVVNVLSHIGGPRN